MGLTKSMVGVVEGNRDVREDHEAEFVGEGKEGCFHDLQVIMCMLELLGGDPFRNSLKRSFGPAHPGSIHRLTRQ